MADKKEIKRRIKSIKNIGQITKALQMVSAVKMRKAQSALTSSTPYFNSMHDVFNNFLVDIGEEQIKEIFANQQSKAKTKHIALILVSPSKGFAGPLLSNLTKKTLEFVEKRSQNSPYENEEFIVFKEVERGVNPLKGDVNVSEDQVDIKLITVEKKSKEFAIHLQKEVIADFPKLSIPPTYEDIIPITNITLEGFKDGSINEIYVVYTHFLNTFTQKAVVKRILPFNLDEMYKKLSKKMVKNPWYTYSKDKVAMFNDFYPRYIETLLFNSVLDAVAAEHSARMIAMKNATDNAVELRKELTLEYNQKRQAAITQEIAEITSAAETV